MSWTIKLKKKNWLKTFSVCIQQLLSEAIIIPTQITHTQSAAYKHSEPSAKFPLNQLWE